MSDQPTQRVAVITGSSSGIGLCTAEIFASRGWRIGLIARGEAGLAEVAGRLRARGGVVAYAAADVADGDALEAAAAKLEADLGRIDVWINNAGQSFYSTFLEMSEAEFRRVMDVTFFGVVHGTRVALRRMKTQGRGTIVQVGSLAAFRGAPLQSAYSAAKFALRGFTEAVRAELIHEGGSIHVAMIHPPSVNTPFFSHAGARISGTPRPLPPVYQPEVIAEAIWLAVTERRREIKVTGATQQMALLNGLWPGLADRIAAWSGFATQSTDREDVARERDPAFHQPATRPPAVHGPFGQEAFSTSAQMWAQRNRWALGLGLAAAALALRPRAERPGSRTRV